MAQAEWLADEGPIVLEGVKRVLVRAVDVEMVEMMCNIDNPAN